MKEQIKEEAKGISEREKKKNEGRNARVRKVEGVMSRIQESFLI